MNESCGEELTSNAENIDSGNERQIESLKSAVLDVITKSLLKTAHQHSLRNGYTVIKKEHVLKSIQEYKEEVRENPRFYRIPVEGDGACLCAYAPLFSTLDPLIIFFIT